MKKIMTAVVLILLGAPVFAQSDQGNELVQSVFQKLLSAPGVARAARYQSWPPHVAIISASGSGARAGEEDMLNAFAAAPDCRPVVEISQGLLDRVVQGNQDRLALILGHELGHVLLGHPPCATPKDNTALIEAMLTRDQEYQADAKGAQLALAAGFSVRKALLAFQAMQQISDYSSFEALAVDHPSWTDRLARLDSEQAALWKSMSAYSDGVYFLGSEQYEVAKSCFRAVVREFPDLAEAKGNLGYAMLMQYIDGLRAEEIRNLRIGQLAMGSYYSQSASLHSRIRGADTSKWEEAVQTLQAALQDNSKLALAEANLGVAYLVKPAGTDPALAIKHLEAAMEQVRSDQQLGSESTADASAALFSVGNNLAVAYFAGGKQVEAEKLLIALWRRIPDPTSERSYLQLAALQYNVGIMLADSADPREKQQGAAVLQNYLKMAPTDSPWWTLAQGKYAGVCKLLDDACISEAQLRSSNHAPLRQVGSVKMASGTTVRLAEPVSELQAQISDLQEISRVPGSPVRRLRSARDEIDFLVSDLVLAIVLNGPHAPALPLQQVGNATAPRVISFGMTGDQLDQVLAGQAYRYEGFTDTWIPYRFYPRLGIAVNLGPAKTVQEVVLVRSSL